MVRGDNETITVSDQLRTDLRAASACLAVGFVVTTVFGQLDPLGVVHADDLTHFLIAKWAWRWPAYLLNDWGRPGFSTLYFLPAGLGWPAARLLSAILSAASAWLAFRIAQHLGVRHSWAVILLCYAQPLFFKLSQTTLTETPLAFYLTLAVYLVQRGHWSASAAVISLCFVTRYEAVVFLPLWAYFAWRMGAGIRRLWPILWAPLTVSLLAPLAGQNSILTRLAEPVTTGQYGRGGWLTYFSRSMEAFGPAIMVLAMTGLGAMWKLRFGGWIASCCAIYFGAHSALRAMGLYETGGYARFLVPISPLVAIAALFGWQRLCAQDAATRRWAAVVATGAMAILWISMEKQLVLYRARRDEIAEMPEVHQATIAIRIAVGVIVAICLVLIISPQRCGPFMGRLMPAAMLSLIVLVAGTLCRPLSAPAELSLIEETATWRARNGLGDRPVISASVWVDYLSGREHSPDRPSVRRQLETAPVGALFAWEQQFAASADHKLPLEALTGSPSFHLIYQSPPAPYRSEPYLQLFEKIAPWSASQAPDILAPR
jgi:hypothetical protein